jgi:hypothetical protein
MTEAILLAHGFTIDMLVELIYGARDREDRARARQHPTDRNYPRADHQHRTAGARRIDATAIQITSAALTMT